MPGAGTSVALGLPEAAGEPGFGIVAPYLHKRAMGWRNYDTVDALETTGG